MATLNSTLAVLSNPENIAFLSQLSRGIEKEGLRCSEQAIISQLRHPKGLGSTLTHPYITTDYSEALLEFITPVFNSPHEALAHLSIAHRFTYENLAAEYIWPSSMPCVLEGEMSVPIADYGTSNAGMLKHVYRHGLWHRYGRAMQCIAGIHYNFSLPDEIWELLKKIDHSQESTQDYITSRYFGLIRNFRRHSWLVLYLFGASPALCKSFLEDQPHNLKEMHHSTLYAPYATSLRMSDFGYQNNAQAELDICYNTLDGYLTTLGDAITIPVAEYEAIGLKDEQGQHKQLNANLLQIENEYYSDIRPKRIPQQGEKPLQALAKYGVQYVEVRNTDLNPFLPLGMDVPQMAFMDVLLVWCLLTESDNIEDQECEEVRQNSAITTTEGRRPNLMLQRKGKAVSLQQWGLEALEEMLPVAQLLDQASNSRFYTDALSQQRLKLIDSSLTPSAQVLKGLEESGLDFIPFTLEQAKRHKSILQEPLADPVLQEWNNIAKHSLNEQIALEESDTQDFDLFLQEYLNR